MNCERERNQVCPVYVGACECVCCERERNQMCPVYVGACECVNKEGGSMR